MSNEFDPANFKKNKGPSIWVKKDESSRRG
jgi:hypothetical protein